MTLLLLNQSEVVKVLPVKSFFLSHYYSQNDDSRNEMNVEVVSDTNSSKMAY